MYHPPFHRRVLPWIFTIVFFAAAPALIFYTAGYRWNSKKEKVERNGTLIIDSKPTGARIVLNGEDSHETTPVTIQNAAPGKYVIRVEKDGYSIWEKQLDVQPEYVTFANTIWLWKLVQPNPTPVRRSPLRFEVSPNEKTLAFAEVSDDMTSTVTLWDIERDQQTRLFRIAAPLHPDVRLLWSSDSRSLLVEDPTTTSTQHWLMSTRTGSEPTALPLGHYTWNGTQLNGVSQTDLLSLKVSDGSVTRTPLPVGMKDRSGDFHLNATTGTDALVLYTDSDPKRGLLLPRGNWRFTSLDPKGMILQDGSQWLSLDPDANNPTPHRVQGDRLRIFQEKQKKSALLINGGELWIWNPQTEPELLLRQSQPLVQALWHSSGQNIILATATEVSILNLDPRDGRSRTSLAQFDRIYDVAFVKKTVYVSGIKDTVGGIWKMEIE